MFLFCFTGLLSFSKVCVYKVYKHDSFKCEDISFNSQTDFPPTEILSGVFPQATVSSHQHGCDGDTNVKQFCLKLFPCNSLLHNGNGKTPVLSMLVLFQLDEETLVTHQTFLLGAPSAAGCPPGRQGLSSEKIGCSMKASQQTSHDVNLHVHMSIYKP